MRSKRVAKLLACTLAMAMSTTPVFASSGYAASKGEIKMDFELNAPVVSVNMQTQSKVLVNPITDGTKTGVSKYSLASKNISVNNVTKDAAGNDVAVLVTASAKIKSAAAGVKTYYDYGASSASKFVASANSTAKELYMELQKGTGAAGAANEGTYAAPGGAGAAVVTKAGSRLQFQVAKASGGTAGYGEFAIIGGANGAADWASSDMQVELLYNIKACADDNNGVQAPAFGTVQAVSHNAISVNNAVMDSTLNGAVFTNIYLYDPKCDVAELVEFPMSSLKFTRTSADDGYDLEISKDDTTVQYLSTEDVVSKQYGLLMVLSDGRVSKGVLAAR